MAAPPPPAQAIAFVLGLRRALLRAADALLPAEAAMWQHTMGLGRAQVIGTIAELGVADQLDAGPATAAQLAPRLGVDADALHRLLRAAADDGVVRLDRRGRFRLTRLGRTLRSDAAQTMRPWARYFTLESTRTAWGDLTESVRTGEAAFKRRHGVSVWDWFAEHPEEERLFAGAMRAMTEIEAGLIATSPLFGGAAVHCDLAGGSGTLLAAMLAERPEVRGVLVEAPGVLTEASSLFERHGLRARVDLVPGNIFERIDAPADVYTLKNVLHDWDDARSLQILANVRQAMPAGSRLVVVEQHSERNRPAMFASITDLHLLTQSDDGRERSTGELQALLRQAGLTPGRVARVGLHQLVEASAQAG